MYAIPTLIGLSIIVFAITRMIGDPVAIYVTLDTPPEMIERIREIYHFNDPIHVQYFYWLQGVLKGDLGYSELVGRPVLKAMLAFFPASAEIAIISITFALIAGIKMGTISAVNRGTWVDHVTRFVSISGRCLPVFWVALILLFFFYSVLNFTSPGRLSLGVFTTQMPPFGSFKSYTGLLTIDSILNRNWVVFVDAVKHLIPPVITQILIQMAVITRVLRSSMLEELSKQYIVTGYSKGLDKKTIIKRYARKNALIPLVTIAGLQFVVILSGVVLTESVFAWPGVGRFMASACLALDHGAILGFTLVIGIFFVVVNLVVDILYAYINPRIKLE